MRRIDTIRKKLDAKKYLKKIPKETEYSTLIKDDTIIYENGEPIIIYKILPPDILNKIRHLVHEAHYMKSSRSNGLPTQSAIFGSLPRVPNRNNYCRKTVNTRTQVKLLNDVLAFSTIIDEVYKNLLPEQHDLNLKIVRENVVDDYMIENTPFTTVNFNVNHAIKHHLDTGNFKNVFSNVLILKENVTGGYLVAPEFDIAFEQSDGALILFDGQKIIHGVTPIKLTKPEGYRCSCVFYSLATMKNCYPYKQELQRIKQIRDEIENRWRSEPTKLTGYVKEMKKRNAQKTNQTETK